MQCEVHSKLDQALLAWRWRGELVAKKPFDIPAVSCAAVTIRQGDLAGLIDRYFVVAPRQACLLW